MSEAEGAAKCKRPTSCRYVAFSAADIAPAMFCHSIVSTSNWRRPALVSWYYFARRLVSERPQKE